MVHISELRNDVLKILDKPTRSSANGSLVNMGTIVFKYQYPVSDLPPPTTSISAVLHFCLVLKFGK